MQHASKVKVVAKNYTEDKKDKQDKDRALREVIQILVGGMTLKFVCRRSRREEMKK